MSLKASKQLPIKPTIQLKNTTKQALSMLLENKNNSLITNNNNNNNTDNYKTDYNSLKIFGFNRADMKYNIPNYKNNKYLYALHYGRFAAPKTFFNSIKKREINFLVRNYQQTLLYEKLFNPNGFKMRMTSNFPKLPPVPELNLLPKDFKLVLLRSGKTYKSNQLKFIVNMDMDKVQLRQILTKLYNIEIESISTAIQPGGIVRNLNKSQSSYTYNRTTERKVAVVTIKNFKNHKYYTQVFRHEDEEEKTDKKLKSLQKIDETIERNYTEDVDVKEGKIRRLNINKALSAVDNTRNIKNLKKRNRINYKNFDAKYKIKENSEEETFIEYSQLQLREIIPQERLKILELKDIKTLEQVKNYIKKDV